MTEWHPIETAPIDGAHIMAYGWQFNVHSGNEGRWVQREIWRKWTPVERYVEAGEGLYRREHAWFNDHWEPDSTFTPTHWKHLWEPPEVPE